MMGLIFSVAAVSAATIKDKYCVGLSGIVSSTCRDNRCVIPNGSSELDCSDKEIQGVTNRYVSLRRRVLGSYDPSAVGFFGTYPFEAIGRDYESFLVSSRPLCAEASRDITDFSRALKGSTDAMRALIEVYLTIPGVNWVCGNHEAYIFDDRYDSFLNDISDAEENYRIAVTEVYVKLGEELLDRVADEIFSFLNLASLAIKRVQVYLDAKRLVRFTTEDHYLFGERVKEAINQLDDLRKIRPDLDGLIQRGYTWLYYVILHDAIALRPKRFVYFTSSFANSPHRHASTILDSVPNLFTAIYDTPSSCLLRKPSADDLRPWTKIPLRGFKFGTINPGATFRIYADMFTEQGYPELAKVIQDQLTAKEEMSFMVFQPRPEHYAETLMIILSVFLFEPTGFTKENIEALICFQGSLGLEDIERNLPKSLHNSSFIKRYLPPQIVRALFTAKRESPRNCDIDRLLIINMWQYSVINAFHRNDKISPLDIRGYMLQYNEDCGTLAPETELNRLFEILANDA
jgi:hypothetical protein